MMAVQNLNVEGLVNQVLGGEAQSTNEDRAVDKASIKTRTQDLKEQRQDRIKNLMDQMKGVSSGKCVGVLKTVAKIGDFLMSPLSLLSMGKLKGSLTKAVEGLDEAKKQGKLAGLQIDGQQISKTIENLKKFVQDDTQSLQQGNDQAAKESEQVLKILSNIEQSFAATNQI